MNINLLTELIVDIENNTNLVKLSSGNNSEVFTHEDDKYNNIVIKKFIDKKEVLAYKKLLNSKLVPSYIYACDEFLIVERIYGERITNVGDLSKVDFNSLYENLKYNTVMGITIRDVHEDNIMVDHNGNIKVIDLDRCDRMMLEWLTEERDSIIVDNHMATILKILGIDLWKHLDFSFSDVQKYIKYNQ